MHMMKERKTTMDPLTDACKGICFVLQDESDPRYRAWHSKRDALYDLYGDYVFALQQDKDTEANRRLTNFMKFLSYAPSRSVYQTAVDTFYREMGFHPGNQGMKHALFSVAQSIFHDPTKDGEKDLEEWITHDGMLLFGIMHHSDEWHAVAGLDTVEWNDSVEGCTNEECTDNHCGSGMCNARLIVRAVRAMHRMEEEEIKMNRRMIRDHRMSLLKSFGRLRLCLEKEYLTKEDRDLITFWKAFSLSPTRTCEERQEVHFRFWFGLDPLHSVPKNDILTSVSYLFTGRICVTRTEMEDFLNRYGKILFHYYDYASWSTVLLPWWKS